MPSVKIDISYRPIIFTVFFLISLFLLFQIRQIILMLFIAIILMTALNPWVDKLERRKIPRSLAILILYILIWGAISFGIAALVPPLMEQSVKFFNSFPHDLAQLTQGKFNLSLIQPQLNALPQQLIQIAVATFNNLIGVFTLMVITFYLILERANLKHYLKIFFGVNNQEKLAEEFIAKLEIKLGGWVRGQIVLMLIVGIMAYIGLILLGVEFAIPLAFLAGLTEIIPSIGPILSAIPAILVALGHSPILAIAVIALYFLIHQLENSLIVPKVMSQAVGLSPLVIIIVLMIGFQLAGIAGAVLAIPTVLLLELVFSHVYKPGGQKK